MIIVLDSNDGESHGAVELLLPLLPPIDANRSHSEKENAVSSSPFGGVGGGRDVRGKFNLSKHKEIQFEIIIMKAY